jgi:hypothetical protein
VACRSRLARARSYRIVVRGSACEAASCTSRSGTPAPKLVESNERTMLSGSACDRADAAPVLAALLNVAFAATFRHLLQPDQLAHPGT